MAEANEGSPAEQNESAPAEAPALDAKQVSEIVAQAMDSRVSGLMSSFDKRFASLQQEVERSQMTPGEIEDREAEDAEKRLAALEAENALLKAGADMPAAVKAFQELNAKETGKEQLDFIQSLIDAAGSGQGAPETDGDESQEEEEVEGSGSTPPPPKGAVVDESNAGSILDQFKDWPGRDFWRGSN